MEEEDVLHAIGIGLGVLMWVRCNAVLKQGRDKRMLLLELITNRSIAVISPQGFIGYALTTDRNHVVEYKP